MATDFALSPRRFLTDHLAGLRGYSTNTIVSHRDAFKLLICYFRDQQSIPPEKLTLERIDAAAITGFLDWLRTSRGNSASTCNQRLAAIDSFFTWMQTQDPARMACCQDILAIPASRDDQPAVTHLSVEQTRRLLAAPDRSTRAGRRDATLLATLYDTAARVQELADLSVRDIRLDGPAMAALTGKGRKTRHVPLDANTTALLAAYLAEQHLGGPGLVFAKDPGDPTAAEFGEVLGEEHWMILSARAAQMLFGEVGGQQCRRVGIERDVAGLAALAGQCGHRGTVQADVTHAQ